jgi:hypothetical protein
MIQVHKLVCENSWIIEMHGATNKSDVLYILIFTFSDSIQEYKRFWTDW